MMRPHRSGSARRALVHVAVVALFAGCETRDPSNPFDPHNPDTGGVPAVMNARAQDGAVELSWDRNALRGARSVRVYRGSASAGERLIATEAASGSGLLRDSSLINRIDYRYRLEAEDAKGRWLATQPDSARPGASLVWCVDVVGGGFLRVTPDGRDLVARRGTAAQYLDLVVDTDGSLWLADYYGGRIEHRSPLGDPVEALEVAAPNALVLDGADLWVGSFLGGVVERRARDGRVAFVDSLAGRVEDIGTAGEGRGVWVASRDSVVTRLERDRVLFRARDFVWPVAVLTDSAGGAFVADRARGEVSRISPEGAVAALPAHFDTPLDLAPDGVGGLWVADRGRSALVRLDATGAEMFAVAIDRAESVTRDPMSGELWVAAGDAGRIVRLDADGRVRSNLRSGGRPIRVDGRWARE